MTTIPTIKVSSLEALEQKQMACQGFCSRITEINIGITSYREFFIEFDVTGNPINMYYFVPYEKEEKFNVGQEVVRSKGDYVVGRKGTILSIDKDKHRAQVGWFQAASTWVKLDCIEPTSIPYEIDWNSKTWPQYKKLAK